MRGFSQAILPVIILASLDAAANVWEGRAWQTYQLHTHTNTTQYIQQHRHRHS